MDLLLFGSDIVSIRVIRWIVYLFGEYGSDGSIIGSGWIIDYRIDCIVGIHCDDLPLRVPVDEEEWSLSWLTWLELIEYADYVLHITPDILLYSDVFANLLSLNVTVWFYRFVPPPDLVHFLNDFQYSWNVHRNQVDFMIVNLAVSWLSSYHWRMFWWLLKIH